MAKYASGKKFCHLHEITKYAVATKITLGDNIRNALNIKNVIKDLFKLPLLSRWLSSKYTLEIIFNRYQTICLNTALKRVSAIKSIGALVR